MAHAPVQIDGSAVAGLVAADCLFLESEQRMLQVSGQCRRDGRWTFAQREFAGHVVTPRRDRQPVAASETFDAMS